ncbi:MAG: hypothetical protein IOC52_08535 [Methylobacterium sp.]|nr:hypothetical protein [Methylobacterium sp.]MCA3624212.1 hypothetical protein [Methylobacterium sp.]
MSSRQALIPAVLRLYSSRPMREWRSLLTAPMLPFWPKADAAEVGMTELHDNLPQGWSHRRHTGDLVIENGGGRVFADLKRHAAADARQAGEPRGRADLSPLLPGGRFIPREPALVLYAGGEASLARFCDTLLPRFFSLDRFGLPQATLLMTSLRMGRTRPFQDAISDGLFRPRPVELFRPATAIRVQQLDDIVIPLDSPEALGPMQAKIAALYGPFAAGGPPVLVLEHSAQRFPAAEAAFERANPGIRFEEVIMLDPALMPFHRLVKAVAEASMLIAPRATGEAAIATLVPSPERRTLLLDLREG